MHPSQKISRIDDGSIELRMKTNGWKELVRFVLSWQPDVNVLEPESLRTRVEEKMRIGLSNTQCSRSG
ncbi:MAG: WYL domain-containing protein [Verrucomicrobia bacterium]|nr:WYL domain-containing protein [Verrucomicrobiota bacterium]